MYDLGNADEALPRSRPVRMETTRRRRTAASLLDGSLFSRLQSATVRSLSLFVPGSTQTIRGQATLGIFFASSLTFLASLAWAVLETLERLALTLDVLGQSVQFVFWTLGVVYLLAAAVHLSAVWSAMEESASERCHPAVSGTASLLLPGWGQLLNGDRLRTMAFLGGLWLVAGTWLASSHFATHLLNMYVPIVSPLEQSARLPFLVWTVKWTAPFVIWSLAVYDAAASAIVRRSGD